MYTLHVECVTHTVIRPVQINFLFLSIACIPKLEVSAHGSFSPLIFSMSRWMGPIATVVYKRIATLITEKRDQPYSRTLFWIRCKLSFSLLRSAIMCIRGSRSSYHHPAGMIGEAIDLTCSEGRIVSSQYRGQTLRFTYSISTIVTFILLFYCFIFFLPQKLRLVWSIIRHVTDPINGS